MKNKLIKIIIVAIGAFILIGCGGNNTNTTKTTGSITVSTETFDEDTGAITQNTTLDIGNTQTTVALSEGTVFIDEDNNTISEPPQAKANVTRTQTTTTSELQLSTAQGDRIIPSEPLRVSVPAPIGARVGDRVRIEVPDGIKSVTKMEKIITAIVNPNNTVDIMIEPTVFRNFNTIPIVIKTFDYSTN